MYASLLTLGAGIIAAGLGLIVSGVSFQPARVDASNDTPGIVATTGGCILVGLAFVVCALLRVEHTPTLRPITRPASVVGLPAPAAQVSAPGKPKAVLPADTGRWTLYSDGSIEAQLPGGTLRFGSITELRNHIEQNS